MHNHNSLTKHKQKSYNEKDYSILAILEVIEVETVVNDNNVDQAIRALKKKMQREGVYKEIRLHRYYEKPSVKRSRKKTEAMRRLRKLNRKRIDREG